MYQCLSCQNCPCIWSSNYSSVPFVMCSVGPLVSKTHQSFHRQHSEYLSLSFDWQSRPSMQFWVWSVSSVQHFFTLRQTKEISQFIIGGSYLGWDNEGCSDFTSHLMLTERFWKVFDLSMHSDNPGSQNITYQDRQTANQLPIFFFFFQIKSYFKYLSASIVVCVVCSSSTFHFLLLLWRRGGGGGSCS